MKLASQDWSDWYNVNIRPRRRNGARLGQKFCNDHNLTDPQIFYEDDEGKATDLIQAKYVDLDR